MPVKLERAVDADVAELLSQVDELPVLPEIPARALSLLDEPEVSLAEVGDVIGLDPLLSARVIRLANSPLFGAMLPVEAITGAVVRVGLRDLRTILVSVAVIDVLKPKTSGLDMRRVWRHAVGSGVIARRLAKDLGEPSPDRAYVAGLLHGMGEVMLALCFPERYATALATGLKETNVRKALLREFGVQPCRFCAAVLSQWHIPEAVVEAAKHQLEPRLSRQHAQLAAIVSAAGRICLAFGIESGLPGESLEGDCATLPVITPIAVMAEDASVWADFPATADLPMTADLIRRAAKGETKRYLETLHVVVESLCEILSALLPSH